MQVFGTPAMGGFNRRGAHPDGGHYYGGAETALGELVRGGEMVLREVMYHDDVAGESTPAPVMITQLRARDVKEKIGVRGRFLLNGALSCPLPLSLPRRKPCRSLAISQSHDRRRRSVRPR